MQTTLSRGDHSDNEEEANNYASSEHSQESSTEDYTTEFEDYVHARQNYRGYVDLYKREICHRCRLNLMVACASEADQRFVFSTYFSTDDTTFPLTKGLNVYTYSILNDQFREPNSAVLYEPPYETINRNFCHRFSGEDSYDVGQSSGINEVKIWELPVGYGVHSINSVFISAFSTWFYVLNAERNLDSQLESLDALLGSIDKFASHSKDDNFAECTFVAFMHKSEEHIQAVEQHIQSKHTYKYIYPNVFALDTDYGALMKKMGKKRRRKSQAPWSWVKLEADILQFCAENGRGCISLNEIEQHARRQFEMSAEELAEFLRHLYEQKRCHIS